MNWREKISPKRAWNITIASSLLFVLIGSLLIIISIQHLFFPWDRNDFIQFSATLKATPKFETSRSGPSLEMKLKEGQNFVFRIDGDNYTVLQNKDTIKQLHAGDRVTVLIDKSQYQAKLSKTISPTFLQRNINWKWIRVFEFKSDQQTFLTLKNVLQELKKVSWYYLTFGLLFLVVSYFHLRYEYRIYKKSKVVDIN